jgi:putative transposase
MAHIHGYKKLARLDTPGAARFITFSCHQQRPIFGIESTRAAFVGPLIDYAASARIELHAWVLMPDHVHLLLTPLEPTLTPSLGDFKEAVVRSVTAINRRPQRIWRPGGGYDRTIFSCGEFREKRLYIHRNAVRAGLVADPAEWRWHSWHEFFEQPRGDMPRIAPLDFDRLSNARAHWLARRPRQ